MTLQEEMQIARKHVVSDGYDMSIGEIINLYKTDEIVIDPEFQRLFRWDQTRKTRFIESLLLGIPVPPIFVYQDSNGVWELIDGLQRLSTILEFVGILKKGNGLEEPSVLEGTRFLPSLAGKMWADGNDDGIGIAGQLQIKRARIRVEILKHESDSAAKYELFTRLNTGGASLSQQEVRNCVAVMLDREFYQWLNSLSRKEDFLNTVLLSEAAKQKQMAVELVLRFIAFRHVPYTNRLDVHEYLDSALIRLTGGSDGELPPVSIDLAEEEDIFCRTFTMLNKSMGDRAFKKWDGHNFSGQFLMSLFEVIATGVSRHVDLIESMGEDGLSFIQKRCKDLWLDPVFNSNSGAGVRGTTRLSNLLPMASDFMRPA